MKNKRDMLKKVFYLSGIIFVTLFFIQVSFESSYANEIHNKKNIDKNEPQNEKDIITRLNITDKKGLHTEESTGSMIRDSHRLWCEEHSVYEDECFICHPELASTKKITDKKGSHTEESTGSLIRDSHRLWCEEHSVYEDECFICHPELASTKNEAPSAGLYCEEHRVPEQECGICHPELTALLKPGKGLKVRLRSTESALKAGVVTAVPHSGEPSAGFGVLCQSTYNMNQLARITPLTDGVIQRVLVDVGAYVSKDDILVEIVSPEIASAKADYLTALANETLKELVLKRENRLFKKRISSEREYQQAEAEYQMVINTTKTKRQKLLNYGFAQTEIQEIVKTGSSSSLLPIRAPFAGTIIERNAVVGEAARPGKTIFSLADLSTMWLEISIPEDRLSLFKVGNLIEVNFNSLPEKRLHGELIWIASNIEERSRMLKARAIVKNLDSQLKHGMFGQVSLLPEHANEVLYIPADSIQSFDKKSFVFVWLSDDLYELRMVDLGNRDDNKVEVLDGLLPHERIVTTGSFTLKSEFLKSRLGEGCVDE